MRSVAPTFTIREEAVGATRVVAIDGEVDLATAGRFKEAMGRALDGDVTGLVVDLEGVSFSDASIVDPLLDSLETLRGRDGHMAAVCCGEKAVRRLLEVTGLEAVIPLTSNRAEALERVGQPG